MSKTKILVAMYWKHESWARRSGYAPMDWADFKASRLENPLSLALINRMLAAAPQPKEGDQP